ncbi:MAG: 50S ribosomal protein L2 [Candidatus Taylorbacteria bacterium]|nr:50S ribosomal protein L2 [Candidatus Taylorbacteria bacterium]
MTMKRYHPHTKSRRHMTTISYRDHLTVSEPHKALTVGFKRDMGRNSQGRITVRHKGGGHRKLYRLVDFVYDKKDMVAKVLTVEYDPFRTGFIALVQYLDGQKRYVLLPQSVKVGHTFIVSETAPVTPGNRLPLRKIPVGTFVYNVEIKPGNGARLVRSAGSFAQVIANDSGYTHVKMPSTEVRKIIDTAWASVGAVSNEESRLVNIGKAGRSRWLGIRPTVRGTAQNPVDHPHGGGEGRQGRGLRRAKSRWGKPTGKGQKTRTPKKYSNVFIVSRRRVGKQKKAE